MRFDQVMTVYRKELIETLRDRRTLIVMIVVPIVLYPLMALFGVQAVKLLKAKIQNEQLSLGVSALDSEFAQQMLVAAKGDEDANVLFQEVSADEATDRVASGELAAAAVFPEDLSERLAAEQELSITLYYDGGDARSKEGLNRLERLLSDLREQIIGDRLSKRDLSTSLIEPFKRERENVASAERQGAFLLGGLLSFLLITMALTGAFYPAVDLSAGEKERGTLETLLVAPVGRGEIILGKYLTVFTISISTSILNLGCMGLTFSQIFSTLGDSVNISFSVNATALLSILLTLIPLAALLSAVTLGSSTFARSFKEAQSYLTPIFMLVVFPAMLPILPGVQMTPILASLPVTGPSLLIRELLLGDASWIDIITVFISTVLYAGVMLAWATDLYQKESALFREEDTSPLRLKRPTEGKRSPTAVAAFTLFVFVLAFSGYINMNASPDSSLVVILVAPQLLIYFLLPLAVAYWLRNDLRHTFSLRLPNLRGILATPLIFVGATAAMMILNAWQQAYAPVGGDYQAALKAIIQGVIDAWGPYGSIMLMALLPAICEEIFCRGFILAGLRQTTQDNSTRKRWIAAIACGLIFGIIHLDPSRLLQTTLLGTMLAWVVIRTGSIWPAMVLHALNNSMAVLFDPTYRQQYSEALTTRSTQGIYEALDSTSQSLESSTWGPIAIFIGGCVVLAVGMTLAGGGGQSSRERDDSPDT